MSARSRTPLWDEIRVLWIASLAIFILTIVIGILNGTDVIDPGHNILITHVHAGTLGWITLSLTGIVLWLWTENWDASSTEVAGARRMAWGVLIAVGLYVVAFWWGTHGPQDGLQRPVGGTLMFIAVFWVMGWMLRRAKAIGYTVPRFAIVLAWVSLIIGAVFGVILGIFLSRGEVPGLSTDAAGRLADAHPPTMVVGYLILAGIGVAEWMLRSDHKALRDDRAGMIQTIAVFIAGVLLLAGLIADSEPLIILNGPFELVGLGIFFWRMRSELAPKSWRPDHTLFVRMGVVAIVVSLGFLLFLVQGVASGRYATDDDIPLTLILAMDHTNFIGIMTNLTFGAIAATLGTVSGRLATNLVAAINGGLLLFVIGIASETTWLKRVGTPVLGLALLAVIYLFVTGLLAKRELSSV